MNGKSDESYYDDAVQHGNESNGSIVTQSSVTGIAGAIVQNMHQGKPYFWTSLPMVTRPEKLGVTKLLLDKENGIDQLLNHKGWPVKDVIITQALFVDGEGRQVVTPKLVLIDPDGNHLSIMARVFVTEFLGLFPVFGNPPWNEPMMVSAKQVKGTGVNKYYSLHLP